MKFLNSETGNILEPSSEYLNEQMKKDPKYIMLEEVKEAKTVTNDKDGANSMTNAQLKEELEKLGVEIPKNANKAKLLELLAEAKTVTDEESTETTGEEDKNPEDSDQVGEV